MGPGSLVADRFEVVRPLAKGGMADVFEATDTQSGGRVALKVLREELTTDPDTLVRFRREAQAAGSIRDPNVALVFDCGVTERNRPFIVMELLEGNDLARELDIRGVLPVDEAVRIIVEAARGMVAAHEAGIVHRDLKPSNLFLAHSGGRRVTKVLDFGISKFVAQVDENVTLTKALFGSPLYMSPEQFRSAKAADHRSDVWSLGVIMYEALTGLPPFVRENAPAVGLAVTKEPHVPPTQRRRSLPTAVDDIIARALQKDPKNRYQSMTELLQGLEALTPRRREDTPTQLQAVTSARPPLAVSQPPVGSLPVHPQLSSRPPMESVSDDPTTLVVQHETGPPPAVAAAAAVAAPAAQAQPQGPVDEGTFPLRIPSSPAMPSRSPEPSSSTVPPPAPSTRTAALFGIIMLFVGAAAATAFFVIRSRPAAPVSVPPPTTTAEGAPSAQPAPDPSAVAPAGDPPDPIVTAEATTTPVAAASSAPSADPPITETTVKKKTPGKKTPPPKDKGQGGLFMPKGI